jgi:hypothetical protein
VLAANVGQVAAEHALGGGRHLLQMQAHVGDDYGVGRGVHHHLAQGFGAPAHVGDAHGGLGHAAQGGLGLFAAGGVAAGAAIEFVLGTEFVDPAQVSCICSSVKVGMGTW